MIISDSEANMLKAVRLLQENMAKVNQVMQQDTDNGIIESTSSSTGVEANDGPSSDTDSEMHDDLDSDSGSEQSDEELDGDTEEGQLDFALPPSTSYRHMSCIVHTLQLTVKPAYKHYETLLSKTRQLIGKIRRSSVAMEKLIAKCGKSVILDCTTRWNSTHAMVKRLITIKIAANEVLCEMGKTIVRDTGYLETVLWKNATTSP